MTLPEVVRVAVPSSGVGGLEAHGGPHAGGVLHLRSEGPLPDQLVQAQLIAVEFAAQRLRCPDAFAGRADGFVGLLGVLGLGRVDPGLVRQVLGAVQLLNLSPGQ
jgi:hypothetical protein